MCRKCEKITRVNLPNIVKIPKITLHPNDMHRAVLFQRRDIKLQIDTKVNVLDLVEVFQKMSHT